MLSSGRISGFVGMRRRRKWKILVPENIVYYIHVQFDLTFSNFSKQVLINFGINLSRKRKKKFISFFLFFYRNQKDIIGIVSCLVEINVHVCANISFNGKTRETSGSNYCINTHRRVFRIP